MLLTVAYYHNSPAHSLSHTNILIKSLHKYKVSYSHFKYIYLTRKFCFPLLNLNPFTENYVSSFLEKLEN